MSTEPKKTVSTFYDHFKGRRLLPWYKIEIEETEDGTKYVHIHSEIHVDKKTTCRHCYGKSYTHAEVLRDHSLGTVIHQRYGKVTCE